MKQNLKQIMDVSSLVGFAIYLIGNIIHVPLLRTIGFLIIDVYAVWLLFRWKEVTLINKIFAIVWLVLSLGFFSSIILS